jgi:hypothetical protein
MRATSRGGSDTGGMPEMRDSASPDSVLPDAVLTVLGVAATAGLGTVAATGTGFQQLIAVNMLLALLLAAATSAVHRGRERRRSADGRSTRPVLGHVLGHAASGVAFSSAVCAAIVIGFWVVATGGHHLGLALWYGLITATPVVLLIAVPIGLVAGLTSGCRASRAG